MGLGACDIEDAVDTVGSDGSQASSEADTKNDSDAQSESPSEDSPGKSSAPGDTPKKSSSNSPKPKTQEDWDKLVAKVFPDDHVVSIGISFKDNGLQEIIDTWKTSFQKVYRETTINWDGQLLKGNGTRLKGYSSLMFVPGGSPDEDGEDSEGGLRPDSKLPLKLNFDKFGGERLHFMDKASLGINVFDWSLMRERLSVRMYKRMGVPAPKTAYARVSLNDKDVGLYTMTQPVDKRFLKQQFGTKKGADDGNLYKCVAMQRHGPDAGGPMVCSLEWHGADKSGYVRTKGCAHGYESCGLLLKTNEEDPEKNDYQDLIHFLDVLNNSSDEAFESAILEVFDVDNFLRLLAATVGMGNFDSYLGRINNYYLYHRPDTGKFVMIPWDFNMSYGHFNCVKGRHDLTQFPIRDLLSLQRNPPERYPLVRRILAVPKFEATYLEYLRTFVSEHFTPSVHEAYIQEFDALIREPLSTDPRRPFTMEQYEEAISNQPSPGKGFFPPFNLLDFVNRRGDFIRSEL